ncbi:hypothetical protein COOONC_27015 [Cooperia oncophora]
MGRIYALLTGPRFYRTFGQPERVPNVVESIGNYSMSIGRAVLAYGGRLVGRTMDHEYRHFINVWLKAKGSGKSEDNQALKRYDFDLEGVNADFHAVRNENLYFHRGASGDSGPLVMCAAWYAVHAFGRHMLYPGYQFRF